MKVIMWKQNMWKQTRQVMCRSDANVAAARIAA